LGLSGLTEADVWSERAREPLALLSGLLAVRDEHLDLGEPDLPLVLAEPFELGARLLLFNKLNVAMEREHVESSRFWVDPLPVLIFNALKMSSIFDVDPVDDPSDFVDDALLVNEKGFLTALPTLPEEASLLW
jgi:hypothetical protein